MLYNPFLLQDFEWDEEKNLINFEKHGVCFEEAQLAFFDEKRVIIFDSQHSNLEKRYYCLGRVNNNVLTVRFTYRGPSIRIIGAGWWRKGKTRYEKENNLH